MLHGRSLGFGRLAEMLVGFACLGGMSIATRREGFWSDEELAHLFGFGLISLYHGAMAATRRGLPVCPFFCRSGHTCFFLGLHLWLLRWHTVPGSLEAISGYL